MATWSIPFDELAARANQRIEDVVRGVAILMFQRVLLRSPVDTGRFRANWNLSFNTIDYSVRNTTDQTGDAKQSEINALLTAPVGGIMYFCNSLPYARVLEYGEYPNPPKFGSKKRGEDGVAIHVINGYSMQAPNGMVRVTAQEFVDAIHKAIAQ